MAEKSKREYRPRLSEEITAEQADALRELIPWGMRKQIFSVLVDDLIRILRDGGDQRMEVLGLILDKSIGVKDIVGRK